MKDDKISELLEELCEGFVEEGYSPTDCIKVAFGILHFVKASSDCPDNLKEIYEKCLTLLFTYQE